MSSGSAAQYRLSSSAENRIKLSQEADIIVIVKIEIRVLLLVLYVGFSSLVVCLFGCLVVLAMVKTVEFSVKRKSNSRQTRYEHGKQFALQSGARSEQLWTAEGLLMRSSTSYAARNLLSYGLDTGKSRMCYM